MEKTCNEVFVACFEILYRNLPSGTEESQETPQGSRYPDWDSNQDLQTQIRSVADWATCSVSEDWQEILWIFYKPNFFQMLLDVYEYKEETFWWQIRVFNSYRSQWGVQNHYWHFRARIAQSVYRLGYGLDDWGVRVRFSIGICSPLRSDRL
jgi:hypothetical protein